MRKIKALALGLFACLSVGAIGAAAAFAELPELTPAIEMAGTGSGETATFEQKEGIGAVTATLSESTFTWENAKEGKFDLLVLGSTIPLGGKCTGLDDKTLGSVLLKGKFKIGYLDAAKTKLGMALKVNPEAHLECEKLITLITIRGTLICELSPLAADTLTYLLLCKQEKGVSQFTEILNASNTSFEKGIVESEVNGGAFKQSGWGLHIKLVYSKLSMIAG